MKHKTETWVVRRPIYIGTDDANEHQEDLELFCNEEINKVERLLLDNGVISMDHWDTGDLSAMGSAEEIYQCVYILKKHRAAFYLIDRELIAPSLWMFIHDIQLGDVVVLPLENGKHAIGIVEGEYEYREISPIVTHTRRVRWLRTDAVIDADMLRGAPGDWMIDHFIGKVAGELPHELLLGDD